MPHIHKHVFSSFMTPARTLWRNIEWSCTVFGFFFAGRSQADLRQVGLLFPVLLPGVYLTIQCVECLFATLFIFIHQLFSNQQVYTFACRCAVLDIGPWPCGDCWFSPTLTSVGLDFKMYVKGKAPGSKAQIRRTFFRQCDVVWVFESENARTMVSEKFTH